MTPFPDQIAYLDAIREAWKQFQRLLVVSPTGSGKTVMFTWVVAEYLRETFDGRALILVDQDELVWQTIRKLRDVAGLHGEAEKAEWRATQEVQVVVATVQSMARRLDKYPRDAFGLVIADEADKSISPQWQSVLKHFESARACGFTATPHRTDKRNLGVFYQQVIELENLFSLIRKRRLAPITVQLTPIKIDASQFKAGADYSDAQADEIISPHLEEIARMIVKHCSFRRTLVFLPLIKTCEKFNTIARDLGLNSDYVFGTDPDRDVKLERFRKWDIDILANSMLLTRGVDIPETDCIVPCRPTKSVTLYFQMVGRGTRTAPTKTDCLLLDFLYQSYSKLKCRPAFLIAESDEEAESITKLEEEKYAGMPADVAQTLDLMTVAGEATSMREAALKKKLEANKDKQAQRISAEAFAMKHNSLGTAEFQPTMPWESNAITPKQMKYLNEAGIDAATVNGTAHASKLLSLHFANKKLKLASHAQRGRMKSMGYANWASATEGEARSFFASLNNRKQEVLI